MYDCLKNISNLTTQQMKKTKEFFENNLFA